HVRQCAECGRLAGAVRAQQRCDRARFEREVDAVQNLRGAVPRVELARVEQQRHGLGRLGAGSNGARLGASLAPFEPDPVFASEPEPRYARITSASLRTSSGVPSAIFRPKSSATTLSDTLITRFMWCSTSRIVAPSR